MMLKRVIVNVTAIDEWCRGIIMLSVVSNIIRDATKKQYGELMFSHQAYDVGSKRQVILGSKRAGDMFIVPFWLSRRFRTYFLIVISPAWVVWSCVVVVVGRGTGRIFLQLQRSTKGPS